MSFHGPLLSPALFLFHSVPTPVTNLISFQFILTVLILFTNDQARVHFLISCFCHKVAYYRYARYFL